MDLFESFKAFWDEGRERVKSNVFGSIVFVFLGFNWREVFNLVFAEVPVVERIKYFDDHVEWYELTLLPIVIGVLLSVLLPWLHLVVHTLRRGPLGRIHLNDDLYAHKRLMMKNKWAEERDRERELVAKRLVSEAQIKQEIDETISNPQARAELISKIGEVGEETVPKMDAVEDIEPIDDTPRMREMLIRITREPGFSFSELVDQLWEDMEFSNGGQPSHRFRLEAEVALDRLVGEGLVEVKSHNEREIFVATLAGYAASDRMDEIPF